MRPFIMYEHRDVISALNAWVASRPNGGRGEWGKLAKHLGISSTLMSQIRKRTRTLSSEHAADAAEYMSLSPKEIRYFILLAEIEKAGSAKLKRVLKEQADEQRQANLDLKERLKSSPSNRILTEEQKAKFYSDWHFSGVRNLVAAMPSSTASEISERIDVKREVIQRVLEFLIATDLLTIEKGKLKPGTMKTHVPADSPWVNSHHRNWRLKALARMTEKVPQDLFYTGPMSLSREAANVVRAQIPSFLEKVYETVGPSKSEIVRCLNIDWFDYEK